MRPILYAVLAVTLLVFQFGSAHARPAPDSFAPLVEKLMPAVVNISTTQKISASPMVPGMPGMPGDPQMDEQLREFFERFLPPGMSPFNGQPMEREAQSLGSGFIIDPDGYIVTNNHVISEATEIKVLLSDETQLDAEIIGRDSKTDIALLKVKANKKLPYVKLGDSDESRVGDWVIAIGNPFGLGGTVTAGIISARARNINAGPFDDFIQTDASINRGNSGGPLFNIDGEVIGINTAIFSPSGGSIGIGFAVPTALADTVIEQLKEHGRTFRGWLGVKIQTVTDEIAESLGMRNARGALIAEISPDGPAEKAGLRVGDVILQFDGRKVDEMQELPRMVAETKIGKAVEVEVLRDGDREEFTVTLGELQEEPVQVAAAAADAPVAKDSLDTYETHGMTLAEINSATRSQLSMLAKDAEGLAVVDVTRGSPASSQGLMFGDVITQVNERKVTTLKAFRTAMEEARKAGRKNALLRIKREETLLFITLPTEKE